MSHPESPTRFAVLLFTDLVGSTDLKAHHGVPAYSAALRVHNDHFERLARECRVRILQNMGDGYFAEAGSVADAVRFALLFQDAMRAGPWGDIRLTTRVGLHAGEVSALITEGGSGMVAPAADLAARVMSLAVGGQILLTRWPFDEARHFLREHPPVAGREMPPLRWLAHGPYLLKGRDEPMEIFEVGAEGFAPLAPPPDGEKAKRVTSHREVGTSEYATPSFVRVRDVPGIFGSDADPGAFSPSLREFEEKLVHRPALAGQVEAALLERRFACLLGKGASGKTTLALLLAFSETFGTERSYYFDLAETDDEPDAAESYRAAMQAIARQHGRDALVIVDNIHLAEGLAHKLHLAWREAGQPVRLLFQGRFTQQGADRRGRQSPLEELKRTALVLEVMREDLAGVLQRLARRFNGNRSISEIPPDVLDQWLKVFGGELIAFSSAARRKLPQIVRGQYQLTEADAADFIREEYIENKDAKRRIDPAERENLLAIAACADWELSVPAEGLLHPPGSALAISMRRGLVWQSTHGRFGQFARYRLCHPGMGKLLWAAARSAESRLDYACEVSQRSPHTGCFVANRLLRIDGNQHGAKRVLTAVAGSPDAFERLIEHGMVALHIICRLLTSLGVMSEGEVDQKLAACKNLADAALATPLGDLANFLKYAQTPMPQVWQALADALADGKNRQTLVDAALATPLGDLANFLEYAQTPMPKVWQVLADALAEGKNRQTLVDAALATPLHFLANFLRYAQTAMPQVWQALADALTREADQLSQTGKVATILALAAFAHNAPISLFEITIRDIRVGHWNNTPDSQSMVGATWLADGCKNANRLDLCSDICLLLLKRARRIDFQQVRGGFAHSCWLLANVPVDTTPLVDSFIERVCTYGWLEIAYKVAKCGELASGLRELSLHQTTEMCRRFHHRGLGSRLNKELERFEMAAPTEQLQIIQFLGCAGLCGWAVSRRSLDSITLGSLSQLPVSVLPHRPEAAEIEDYQMQLWLGLRAFVSITRERLPLTRETIEATLTLWRANLGGTAGTPTTAAHRVNLSMVAWLETCSRANPPALVPSPEPLWVLAGFPLQLNLPQRVNT